MNTRLIRVFTYREVILIERNNEQNVKTGAKSVFACLGSTNHSDETRASDDFYATDPSAMKLLLDQESFSHKIWEPACGAGHLSKVLEQYGYDVRSTDIVFRGYGEPESLDFLQLQDIDFDGDIITNPPYKFALDFVKKALDVIQKGHKCAMFLRIQFLEGKQRREFFKNNPPKVVYVSSSRLRCARNGDFDSPRPNAICFCWFVWEKGFKGDPIIKWIN